MFAFTPSLPIASTKPVIGSNSFVTPLHATTQKKTCSAPTMVLRTTIRYTSTKVGSLYGGAARILRKADNYMGSSITKQYLQMSNPSGVFSVACTEGSVKFAAEAQRVRALNTNFRASQASPFKKCYDVFENRKAAITASHECSHEEAQFSNFSNVCASYNLAKAEANGSCFRYATPETVEEAAMLRYMDIQQNNSANPSGVYNTWCNEGSCKGAAEDLRVAALNVAFRNGQKPLGQILQEKYNQKAAGYAACHGCSYEEGLVSLYPAIGAAFRSKSYGY